MKLYSARLLVLHAEIEPLSVPLSVRIHAHVQIILQLSCPAIILKVPQSPDLGCHSQIGY